MKHTLTFLAAAALIAAAPMPSPSAAGTQFSVGVWTVHMTSVDVNFKTGDFSTPNKVTMNREGGDITGDRANGNYKTKSATLYGHVVMHDTQGNFGGLSSTNAASNRGPATLTADQVNIDGTARVYTATGHVHYVQADTTVDAEKGVLNDATHELDLQGNVHIVQGDRNIQAQHVVYNTIDGKAHAEGNVVMQFPSQVNPHFATPKPIKIKNPLQKHTPEPSPSPR
jgi:lipopolysaccharide assembly outer membrane protein LptD (OstA)